MLRNLCYYIEDIECYNEKHDQADCTRDAFINRFSVFYARSINDFDEATSALHAAIEAGELEDEVLVPYLARRAYRDEWLYWPVTRLYPNRSWSALD